MSIYTIPECEECEKIVKWIKENNKNVNIIELKNIDGKWMEPDEDGLKIFNEEVHAFPALKLGHTFLMGFEGIQRYIKKGFLHEVKTCPYFQKLCLETECEKFVLLKTGEMWEGGCSDYMSVKLLTQLNKRLQQ